MKAMSKLGPLINGDSSNLNDALVGSMDGRAMRSRDYLRDDWTDKLNKMFSCDVDHMYASVNDDQSKDREIVNLKELHLVHLDIIQSQSDMILLRDREIAALREERDRIRSKCQRLERRVTLQRQKEIAEHVPVPSTPILPLPVEAAPVPTLLVTAVDETPPFPVVEPPAKRRRSSMASLSRRKRRTISTGSDRTKASLSASEYNELEKKVRTRLQLTSESEYYTAVGDINDVWGPLDLRVPVECDLPQEEEQVQVPSWREKILSPLYVIEGTENLEDEVFHKRHLKLESDERRRKRWDIQRMREQTHVERLKKRGLKGRSSASNSISTDTLISSFFPAQEEVQEISVEPTLPVIAFGLPLRVFDPCEFNLSWTSPSSKYINLRQR